MSVDYSVGRQRAHLNMNAEEFNRLFGAVAQAFGLTWLESGNGPLSDLWRRADALAVNQLCLLGDAISGFNAIDPNWVKEQVKKIKGKDANGRRGSMFELLGANLFRKPPQTVKPTKKDNPGFDLVATLPDGSGADISLKSYGNSAHETLFRREAAKTEKAFKEFLRRRGAGGVFFAIAKSYPAASDWDQLKNSFSKLSVDAVSMEGIWSVKIGSLPPDYGPYSSSFLSHQTFVASPFHPNEKKNLSDKFDAAFANAEKHAIETPDQIRIVLMRIPEALSLVACESWASEYLTSNPDSPIDSVWLYQLCVVDQPDDTSVMAHAVRMVDTPRFTKWRADGKKHRGFRIHLAVGIPSDPSSLQISNGLMQFDFADGYAYQRGEYFTLNAADGRTSPGGSIRNVASGIFQHVVVKFPDGREIRLSGRFPPTKEVTLFD